MPSSQRDTPISTWQMDFSRLRGLMQTGTPFDVIESAELIVAETSEPRRVAQALQFVVAANMNMRDRPGVAASLARASDAMEMCDDSRLTGNFHALAAWSAYQSGSVKRCGIHLISSERALSQLTAIGEPSVAAWRNLGLSYSILGFHERAVYAYEKMLELSDPGTLCIWDKGIVQATVRRALAFDHRGDSQACIDELQKLLANPLDDPSVLEGAVQCWINFAARRLNAMGVECDIRFNVVPPELPVFLEMQFLAEACAHIAAGQSRQALEILDGPGVGVETAGEAEPLRLRSLALTALGDNAGALASERKAMWAISSRSERLRPLLLDSVGAFLDHEHLRRTAARYADAAMTDPLTGLPNRRRLETFVAELAARNSQAMIGVLDLDGFKAVNDTYGHATGDQVLQRVAGILARSVRIGDLLARRGGDEFVVIMPETTIEDAASIGERITQAVVSDDWQKMVIDTPVSISIGWAPLRVTDNGIAVALHEADQAMYRVKRARRQRC